MPTYVHRFEVGRLYHVRFDRDKDWTHFRCTERVGNRITLTEYKGVGRIFEGEIQRASCYETEVNEYIDIGVEHHSRYDKIIQIPARNFWYGMDCR